MCSDPTGLGKVADAVAKVADSEIARKAYQDTLSKPLAEASEVAAEVIRGLRLFTTPFLLMADFRERMLEYCALARSRVPESRQIEASPTIAGPVFERLRYEPPDSRLVNLYLQLLISAIDSSRVSSTHPAFPGIIAQLSPDQAVLLLHLKRHGSIETEDECSFDHHSNQCTKMRTVSSPIPEDRLQFPEKTYTSLWHMLALSLLDRPNLCAEIRALESHQRTKTLWTLDDFGLQFVEACVPNEPIVGFEI